jgi:hypothetical protein
LQYTIQVVLQDTLLRLPAGFAKTSDQLLLPHLLLLLLLLPLLLQHHHLQDWLSRNDRSPITNKALGSKRLLPNHALRSAIMEAQHAAATAAASGSMRCS